MFGNKIKCGRSILVYIIICDKLAVGMFKDVEYMLKYRLESHNFQGYVRRINKRLNWNG